MYTIIHCTVKFGSVFLRSDDDKYYISDPFNVNFSDKAFTEISSEDADYAMNHHMANPSVEQFPETPFSTLEKVFAWVQGKREEALKKQREQIALALNKGTRN